MINKKFKLQWEEKQDCFVLLYPEGMVQLNFTAGEIMKLCDGKHIKNDIIKTLEDKFNTSNLKDDVESFLKEALKRKWITHDE